MADGRLKCGGDDVGDGLTPWQIAARYLPDTEIAPLPLVKKRILQDRALLWLGDNCAGVTETTDDNQLHIWTAGGSMRGLIGLLDDVECFAKLSGCDGVMLGGRTGWRRVMAKYGYALNGDNMVKLF